MSLVLDEHREYLSDSVRLDAFRTAIHSVVRPGDVVVDLASGTGILGMLACRAGAARVYAIEQDGLAGLARELAAHNGLADRITVIREHSTRATLPERGDVLVTDQIGHFGFEVGLLDLTWDAAHRLLKPSARFIPRALRLLMAPVECAELRARASFWDDNRAGFAWGPAATIARNTGYPMRLDPAALLDEPQEIYAATLPVAPQAIDSRPQFRVARRGVLDGLGGWFEAALGGDAFLTNDPRSRHRLNRRNAVLPLSHPVPVDVGDVLDVSFRAMPERAILAWRVAVRFADGRTPVVDSGSTFAGMLLSREDLRATQPDATLHLTRAGEARREVITRVDGRQSVAGIQADIRERFPDLFSSDAAVAAFVAEVLTRYAR